MRKPKSCLVRRLPPVPRGSIAKFDQALEELRKYGERAGDWDEMCDFLASQEIEKCVRSFLLWWDGEQSTPPPHYVRSQLRQMISAASHIVRLREEGHWAARVLVAQTLRKITKALSLSMVLEHTQTMLEAIECTAVGPCAVRDRDAASAKLYLAESCLRMMADAAGGIRPGLAKYNHVNQGGPFLRFIRAVFEYATGLRSAQGSFDNEVKALRLRYPPGSSVRCTL